jgi:GT2 family glycosyltransferase/glycosyltransferase involved in cell wall biosynthesis/predicted nuclease with TOPRIM domain
MRTPIDIPHRLLISGPNGGGLALVSRSQLAVLGLGNATGLAVSDGTVAWCAQDDGANRIQVLRDGVLRTLVVSESALDLHDLLADPGGDGYRVVATEENAVLHLGRDGGRARRAFSEAPDSWHLNSLAWHQGRLLASHFGRFDTHRGYKGRTRAAGEVIDVGTGEVVVSGLSQPHSLVSVGDELWLCSSETSELWVTRDGERLRSVVLPGYTRGLVVADGKVYVGLSRSRNEPLSAEGRRFETAVVAVLDRADLSVLGFVPLPWPEIYDIRVLGDDALAESLLVLSLDRAERRRPAEPVVVPAPVPATEIVAPLLAALRDEGQSIRKQSTAILDAISDDIRRMQAVTAQAQASATELASQAEFGRSLGPQLDTALARHAELQATCGTLLARGEALHARADALQERVDALQAANGSLQSKADTLQATWDLLQANHAELRARHEALQAGSDALQARHHALEASGALLQSRHDALQSEHAALQSQHAALVASRQSLEASHAALLQARTRLEAGLADERRAREQLQSERDALAADADASHRALAAARHEIEALNDVAAQLAAVRTSLSWRLTRPLRVGARILRGQWGAGESDKIRRLLRGAVARAPLLGEETRHRMLERTLPRHPCQVTDLPTQAHAPMITLAPEANGLPDIFVWAVIDWHFRFQRPQHLARALAEKGHRVFYLSNNLADSADPGFRVCPLDDSGRLFQVHLNLQASPAIYYAMPDAAQVEALRASLGELLAWTGTRSSISLVQHPFWSPLVRALPSARVVYDCMDHHGGFENNAGEILVAESRLVADADLVIVTSGWLEQEVGPRARAVATVRNGCEHCFFRDPPAEVFRDEAGRRVIGYFGAIAEWFDLALVREVAIAHPDALVLLVGNDTVGAGAALADLPNVRLTGEVRYDELPYWVHGFDVCLLPFRVIPLTEATNPVKVYEYLAAGKPVVAVDLPEMGQFDGLVHVATDAAGYVQAVSQALAEPGDPAPRQAFAAGQTWLHRADALDAALAALPEPRVSVVVLTYNNLAFTEACLDSIELYSDYPDLEVIVVDNASSDGSREWLRDWQRAPSAAGHQRRLFLNEDNLGFSAGNNVGLRAATGDVLVMLNNDTYVTPGWVRGLCNHLRQDPGLGLLGPVTNNIGNEARIEIHYADMAGMIAEARKYTGRHPGRRLPIRTAAFFCVAMRRDVYERIGDMDEAFGVGFFEDDDYCRRIEQAGLAVACAEDVFIHHHLSASFDALKAETRKALFDANKAIYEAKWGPWQPHAYRPDPAAHREFAGPGC